MPRRCRRPKQEGGNSLPSVCESERVQGLSWVSAIASTLVNIV